MSTHTSMSAAEMERAFLSGDAAYRGLFVVGVRTTGIFCRTGCPARKPLARNVEYFATPREAMTAGYRPCKRCHPLDEGSAPEWAARLLADVERDPSARISDAELVARGVDPGTARRYFQRTYGMTFQAFVRARRLSVALSVIREGESIDQAVFESGYESHSGFREAFARAFGAAPGRRPERDEVFVTRLSSPLGPLVAGATSRGVCLLEFTDRRMLEKQLATVGRLFGGPLVPRRSPHLSALSAELNAYFEGRLREFSVPLDYPGTPFQKRVWDALLAIPYGQTRSYEEMAAAVGTPRAVRAVGHANGMNRIAIVIPCHRVVNKDGRLGGYGGGLRRKEHLLELERRSRAPAAR